MSHGRGQVGTPARSRSFPSPVCCARPILEAARVVRQIRTAFLRRRDVGWRGRRPFGLCHSHFEVQLAASISCPCQNLEIG